MGIKVYICWTGSESIICVLDSGVNFVDPIAAQTELMDQ